MLVMLANFAYFLAVGATLPVLPRFVEGPLGAGEFQVGLTFGAFALSAVLLRPWIGRIGDARGRRLLVIWGGALVGASVGAQVFVDSLMPLLVLRLATGAGEAAFYVGVASAINDLAPDERRGEALSYFSLSLFAGIGLGPVVGESVQQAVSFDAAWLVAGGLAFAASFTGLYMPETRPDDMESGETAKLVHPAALVPGAVMAASIWGLATFTAFVPLYALLVGLDGSRYLFAGHSAIVFAIRLLGARIPDRLGAQRSATGALICSVLGFIVIAFWRDVPGLVIGMVIWSVGHSLAFPALMSMAVSAAPARERGAVVGTFTAFFDLSFGLGAVTAGGIVDVVGYRGGFLSSSVAAGAGLVLLRTRRRRQKQAGIEEAPATLSLQHGGRSSVG